MSDRRRRGYSDRFPHLWQAKAKPMPELTTAKSVLLTDLALCVNYYRLFTPGIYVCLHVPVQLDHQSRIVPGLVAMVNHGRLKQCEPVDNGFEGPPNFVLDVFDPDDTAEYESRRNAFERAGVTEYVAVFDGDPLKFHWNRNDGTAFVEAAPDRRGILKSLALPGLWFPVQALAGRNWWSILSTIDYGVSRKGHHEFMETIWHKAGRSGGDETIPFEEG